jgi:predicted outer membrane protein
MKWKFSNSIGPGIVMCGMVLAAVPSSQAQMRPGSMGQGQQPGMQQNNRMQQNNQMGNQQMNEQDRAQMDFVSNMRRNIKVETDLSKMAMKNSSSDQVKQFASQVIAVNRKGDSSLNDVNPQMSNMMFPAPVPSETKKAEKDMKKATGPDFDKLYIGQMDGYIKNDQQLTTTAAATIHSGNMAALVMQMRDTAAERMKDLTQVAQSENLKLQ